MQCSAFAWLSLGRREVYIFEKRHQGKKKAWHPEKKFPWMKHAVFFFYMSNRKE